MIRALIFTALIAGTAQANPLEETRCCTEPKRNAKGEIVRRADMIAAFRKLYPCPVTGKTTGACPGWAVDHVISLKCGGADSVSNSQWLPKEIKSCRSWYCKDRFERKIYCKPFQKVQP